MARKGSRVMMKDEESGVDQSPRPAPICCASVLLIPSPAVLGAAVPSTSWPRTMPAVTTRVTATPTTLHPTFDCISRRKPLMVLSLRVSGYGGLRSLRGIENGRGIATGALCAASDEPLEPGILAHGIEVGVDGQPARRKVVR